MTMLEEEAKKKWCPFARQMLTLDAEQPGRGLVGGVPLKMPIALGSANRFTNGGGCTCLGSACMAWRRSSEMAPESGYCGLAGKEGWE